MDDLRYPLARKNETAQPSAFRIGSGDRSGWSTGVAAGAPVPTVSTVFTWAPALGSFPSRSFSTIQEERAGLTGFPECVECGHLLAHVLPPLAIGRQERHQCRRLYH